MDHKKDLNNIKNLLVRIRTAKHLSQFDLTNPLCTQGMLSKIETGKASPSFLIVLSLLKQMDISLSEFEYLYFHDIRTKEQLVEETLNHIIDTYQFSLLQEQKHQHMLSFYPHYASFIPWVDYCFGIQFPELEEEITPIIKPGHVEKLLSQDEFFDNDFYLMIYHLITLKNDTAFYNYQRILDQIKNHHIKHLKPCVAIDATITIATIFFKKKDYTNAYHYYYVAFQKSRHLENIPRMIICQIILSFLADDEIFLRQAMQLSQLFSKDIFYDYWYNVLYKKFKEV